MSRWSTIKTQYNTFFVDLVGVIYDGITVFPQAIQALNQLEPHQKLIFISNNPRPSDLSVTKLKTFGFTHDFTIVTSGDYARAQLSLDQKAIYYHWGAERNTDILDGISLKLTDNIHQADKVLLTAFIEETDDPTKFDPLIDQIISNHLPVFCANPDRYAFNGAELRKCAGYFADKLLYRGGDVTFWGKPNITLYEFVEQSLSQFEKSTCLMIGDTLETDIIGAAQFGIDSLLVLSGVSEAWRQSQSLTLEQLTEKIKPTYVCQQLGD